MQPSFYLPTLEFDDMKPSLRLWNYLKDKEDFRQSPYQDEGGKWHIGYGHLIRPGETFTKVNTQEAEEIMKQNALPAVDYINNVITTPLNQNQFDALVSLVYNIGVDHFSDSELKELLCSAGMQIEIIADIIYQKVAGEFIEWRFVTDPKTKKKRVSNGLVRRRLEESEWFMEPVKEDVK